MLDGFLDANINTISDHIIGFHNACFLAYLIFVIKRTVIRFSAARDKIGGATKTRRPNRIGFQ